MLHQKYITIQEDETSTEKDEYQYLYRNDGELKSDNIENEGFIEYGNNFINCTLILNKTEFVEKNQKNNQN